jgi:CTP:molybdopterin cytidylyltransferase MocA
VRATDIRGRAGHPVGFPARLLPALLDVSGDLGAREVLTRNPPQPVPLPGQRATLDLDTPEDWAAWRQGSGPGAAR